MGFADRINPMVSIERPYSFASGGKKGAMTARVIADKKLPNSSKLYSNFIK